MRPRSIILSHFVDLHGEAQRAGGQHYRQTLEHAIALVFPAFFLQAVQAECRSGRLHDIQRNRAMLAAHHRPAALNLNLLQVRKASSISRALPWNLNMSSKRVAPS